MLDPESYHGLLFTLPFLGCLTRDKIFSSIDILILQMSRAMRKCVFGVNFAILRFCDFYTGHYMKSKLVFV